MTERPIRFFHRGRTVEVADAAPTRTVLDWLREDAHCTGTKEGCNEGDCGACTVVVGEIAAANDAGAVRGLALRTVNACIQFLPALDGRALFTVEDLKPIASAQAQGERRGADPRPAPTASRTAPAPASAPSAAPESAARPSLQHRLHPVQQAMVDCHGSQCGFCTPGFVMSLWSAYEHHQACATRPTRQQLADELSGNLCRCTGYRPILDAGQRMFDLDAVALDTAPVLEALTALAQDAAFSYVAAEGHATGERGAHFHAPTTLADLARLREAHPKAQLLAGCTDIGLWVNKQFRPLGDILYVGKVDELKTVEVRRAGNGDPAAPDAELYIGAGASLEAAWSALAQRVPALVDVWLRFASPPIRNAGTMGGNVANGSPIGDAPPVLIALDAEVELRRGERTRRMLLEDFYVDYMKNRMEPGEFVQAVAVPLAATQRTVRAYKISKRFDSDISAVCGAFAIELDGDVVKTVRLAFGGMAAIVERAARAEAALLGQPWTQASVTAAQAALAQDFAPLTDMRASAAYRMQVAQNLLQRCWLETRTDDPMPASATSVYSVMPHGVVPHGVVAAAPAAPHAAPGGRR